MRYGGLLEGDDGTERADRGAGARRIAFFNFTAVKFNHDVLQLPFWALTGLFVYRAITEERPTDWMLSGVWLAGAFWTKYPSLSWRCRSAASSCSIRLRGARGERPAPI